MKTIKNAAALSLALLVAGPANATEIKSAGNALALCENFAEETQEGYKRSKSLKIRATHSEYQIKLRVFSELGAETVKCTVTRYGAIDYLRANDTKNVATK